MSDAAALTTDRAAPFFLLFTETPRDAAHAVPVRGPWLPPATVSTVSTRPARGETGRIAGRPRVLGGRLGIDGPRLAARAARRRSRATISAS